MMESAEFSSRLSAFDSFLFLSPDQSIENQDDASAKNGTHQSDTACREAAASKEDSGTNITIDPYEKMPTESNVRCIPGSAEEKEVMQNKLSAFDQFMFLLNSHEAKKEKKNTSAVGAGAGRQTIPNKKVAAPHEETQKNKHIQSR